MKSYIQFFISLTLCSIIAFSSGCNQQKDSADNSDSQTEELDSEEKGYLDHAEELFQKAKKAGTTTASNVGDWISETASGVMESTSNAAQNTGDWISDTYESLRDKGMTTAKNTSEWVQEDFKNMYAFEYKVLAKDETELSELETLLNELGKQRWECIAVDDSAFYFKRKRTSYLRNVPLRDVLRFIPGNSGEGE